MNPIKHIDWKVVLGVVVGAYALAVIEATAPKFSPTGVAKKVSGATA